MSEDTVTTDKTNIDENVSTDKTIYSGSDASVGLAVPADHSGGELSSPDPVIEKHNDLVSRRLKGFFRAENNSPSINYEVLPVDSPVRKRAELAEENFAPVYRDFVRARLAFTMQKSAASRLESIANDLANELSGKSDKWRNISGDNKTAHLVTSPLESMLSVYVDRISSSLQEYGFVPEQVSPTLNNAFFALASLDTEHENPFQTLEFDAALQLVYDAIEELGVVKRGGGGDILSNYQSANTEVVEYTKRLNEMAHDVEKSAGIKSEGGVVLADEQQMHDELKRTTVNNGIFTHETHSNQRTPNYRIAFETSPRVCGSCRFFEWSGEDNVGHCYAFDFDAKANYTCDAWQSESITSVHTPVRNETPSKMRYNKNVTTDHINYGHSVPGAVVGQNITTEELDDIDVYQIEDIQYGDVRDEHENAVYRASRQKFLPGDYVYSKSLRSYGVIQSVGQVHGKDVYGLNLIGHNGTLSGTAATYSSDLIPKSKSATKHEKSRRVKSNEDVQEFVVVTRDVNNALETILDTHHDLQSNPLSNKDVLQPLYEQIASIMDRPMFGGITVGPKRKYYRALQSAFVAIGAARQILFAAYREIKQLKDNGHTNKEVWRDIMFTAQQKAYNRLVTAQNHVFTALTLPSATHGHRAPGTRRFKR